MSERYLIIKAKGGLGNRILSAITGLIYADITGRTPIIDWCDGIYASKGINAYNLLFDSPLEKKLPEFHGYTDIIPTVWQAKLAASPGEMISEKFPNSHSSPLIYRKLCVPLDQYSHEHTLAIYWTYLPKFSRLKSQLMSHLNVNTIDKEAVYFKKLDDYFIPNIRVRNRLSSLFPSEKVATLGVHIRYTDLKVPLDKIINNVRRMNRLGVYKKIFLATDNAQIQERFSSEFEHVFWNKKNFAKNNNRLHSLNDDENKTIDAENALIDMFALAECDALIYSSQSTFSYTSKLLGRFNNKTAMDVDRFNIKNGLKKFIQDRI